MSTEQLQKCWIKGTEEVHCVPGPKGKAAVAPTDLRRPPEDAQEAKRSQYHTVS